MDEMVFLEEEREKELEGLFEAELDRDDVTGAAGGAGMGAPPKGGEEAEEGKEAGNDESGSGPATKRSLESVKAGERLMDALELAEQEEVHERADAKVRARAARRGEAPPPARRANPILLNLSPLRYVLRTLQVGSRAGYGGG